MVNIKIIAFDADDTLWVNEPIFTKTQEACKSLLKKYIDPAVLEEKLYSTEVKNLKLFGYGVKGFTLSMIETAIELSEGKITGQEIQSIIALAKEMVQHPVELLPNIKSTLEQLQDQYELMIITKGDLFDQESKIARSGIADYFNRIEIVSEKDEQTYQDLFRRHNIELHHFLMLGNSLKSDVLPIIKLGGQAIHIPFHTTWVHETVPQNTQEALDYVTLKDVSLLPQYLDKLQSNNNIV